MEYLKGKKKHSLAVISLQLCFSETQVCQQPMPCSFPLLTSAPTDVMKMDTINFIFMRFIQHPTKKEK